MPRLSWGTAGAVAGLVGLAASHAATMALTVRSSPVVAVAEVIVEWTPAVVADRAIRLLGSLGKPVLVAVVVLVLLGIMAAVGRVAARSTWLPLVAYLLLGTVAAAAIFRTSPVSFASSPSLSSSSCEPIEMVLSGRRRS